MTSQDKNLEQGNVMQHYTLCIGKVQFLKGVLIIFSFIYLSCPQISTAKKLPLIEQCRPILHNSCILQPVIQLIQQSNAMLMGNKSCQDNLANQWDIHAQTEIDASLLLLGLEILYASQYWPYPLEDTISSQVKSLLNSSDLGKIPSCTTQANLQTSTIYLTNYWDQLQQLVLKDKPFTSEFYNKLSPFEQVIFMAQINRQEGLSSTKNSLASPSYNQLRASEKIQFLLYGYQKSLWLSQPAQQATLENALQQLSKQLSYDQIIDLRFKMIQLQLGWGSLISATTNNKQLLLSNNTSLLNIQKKQLLNLWILAFESLHNSQTLTEPKVSLEHLPEDYLIFINVLNELSIIEQVKIHRLIATHFFIEHLESSQLHRKLLSFHFSKAYSLWLEAADSKQKIQEGLSLVFLDLYLKSVMQHSLMDKL